MTDNERPNPEERDIKPEEMRSDWQRQQERDSSAEVAEAEEAPVPTDETVEGVEDQPADSPTSMPGEDEPKTDAPSPQESGESTPESPEDSRELAHDIRSATQEITNQAMVLENRASESLKTADDAVRRIRALAKESNPQDQVNRKTVALTEQAMPALQRQLAEVGDTNRELARTAHSFFEEMGELTLRLEHEEDPTQQAQIKEALEGRLYSFQQRLDFLTSELEARFVALGNVAERVEQHYNHHLSDTAKFLEGYTGGRANLRDHPVSRVVDSVRQLVGTNLRGEVRATLRQYRSFAEEASSVIEPLRQRL